MVLIWLVDISDARIFDVYYVVFLFGLLYTVSFYDSRFVHLYICCHFNTLLGLMYCILYT